jgi:hypothetical protein
LVYWRIYRKYVKGEYVVRIFMQNLLVERRGNSIKEVLEIYIYIFNMKYSKYKNALSFAHFTRADIIFQAISNCAPFNLKFQDKTWSYQ